MTQSVELLLDEQSEARVVRQWRSLEEAGLPSQSRHRGETNRPHVTLAAVPSVAEDAEEPIARICAQRLPLEVRLGALALFGDDPVVLVRLVVLTAELVALHASVAAHLVLGGDSLVAPGRWTPHVTLARRLPVDQVPAALRVLAAATEADDRRLGVEVRLAAARRWDGAARQAWPLA
jgi:2'-5' RNA ligase